MATDRSGLGWQDRLALALTSYGSVSALANDLGVSARTAGRWLREGQEGGVREIPPYARRAIDVVFQVHRQVSRAQALAQGIPYNMERPVFMERRPLSTGELGDRVFVDRTEHIRPDLRMRVMYDQQLTRQYVSASVASEVNLRDYMRAAVLRDAQLGRRVMRGSMEDKVTRAVEGFVAREREKTGREVGVIADEMFVQRMHTQYENISYVRRADDVRGVEGIEKQLRRKMEPAVGSIGTVLADQYLFQLLPEAYHERAGIKRRKQQRRRRG